MRKRGKTRKQMRETIGIDLGDKISRYCMADQDGEVVEEGSFRNQASSIEKPSAESRGGSRTAARIRAGVGQRPALGMLLLSACLGHSIDTGSSDASVLTASLLPIL